MNASTSRIAGGGAPAPAASVSLALVSRVAWRVLCAALVAVHLVVAVQSLAVARFWEDEAFNLTVPLNVVRGLGYASDGAITGTQITPFDEYISTGPVVLLPVAIPLAVAQALGVELTGAAPAMLGRLVPLAFWMLLLAALVVLGHRIAGRWGALVAAAMPLVFTLADSPSPIQGPTDLVGEIPAAAMLVWALVALRDRPWLAGLFFGLAIQIKLISFLAAPALVVGLLIVAAEPARRWLAVLWRPVVFAVLPTLVFELWILVSLGPAEFAAHIGRLWAFLVTGGQELIASNPLDKLTELGRAWFLPARVTGPLALLGLVVVVAAVLVLWRWARRGIGIAAATAGDTAPRRAATRTVDPRAFGARTDARELVALLSAAIIGAAVFVGWWMQAEHTPVWVRHPAPGLFAYVPIIAAFVALAARVLALGARTTLAGVTRDGRPVALTDAELMRTGPAWIAQLDEAEGPGARRAGGAEADPLPYRPSPPTRVLGVLGALAIAAFTAFGTVQHLRLSLQPQEETLAEQGAVAQAFGEALDSGPAAEDGWVLARPWGPSLTIGILSGHHTALPELHMGFENVADVSEWPVITMDDECPVVVASEGRYRLCLPTVFGG